MEELWFHNYHYLPCLHYYFLYKEAIIVQAHTLKPGMGFVAAFLLFSFAAIVEGDYDDPPKPKISETFSTWVSFEHLYSYYY